MDAVEYIRAVNRMCSGFQNCGECPCVTIGGKSCDDLKPERLVSITEQWAKENPIRTRQGELLKLFPDASTVDGILLLCPGLLNGEIDLETGIRYKCKNWDTFGRNCKECRRKFWMEEVGEK